MENGTGPRASLVNSPAKNPRCPICDRQPNHRAERLNRGVMLGDYADAVGHIWSSKWLAVAA